jgi:hypothetical protein
MTISFARYQFPPAIIRHAVWLYVRFTLSYRDVEDLLAERGLDASYETVRRWVLKALVFASKAGADPARVRQATGTEFIARRPRPLGISQRLPTEYACPLLDVASGA